MPSEENEKPNAGNTGVKIILRIKPTKKPSGYFQWNEEENMFVYDIPKDVASGLINNSRTEYKFKFDAVVGMDATQDEVFDIVGGPCVKSALQGFNSTVFAYGQTGSGKTFTITGGAERYVDRGIIPRSLSMIFNEASKNSESQITVYVSYLEIYNGKGYDLLDQNRSATSIADLPRVTMLEDENGNTHLRNLSMHRANNEEEALNFLFVGDTNRAVSETAMNLTSSRSHCIFTVSIESRIAATGKVLRSKLHLVDLAGSERAHKTGAAGKILKEAAHINGSLHFLEMVIVALHERATNKRTHIPYRNSMMTSVLRDSLGGNCKTSMIATVSAESEQTDESISTCRFAQRVARVKNDAFLNEELDPHIIIKRLKSEIVTLKEEIAFLKGEAGEGDAMTEEDSTNLQQKCLEYLNDKDPEAKLAIGELTYTRIRACFQFLKASASVGGSSAQALVDVSNGCNQVPFERGSTELEAKIENLETCLQQRDNEIAILVDMVKEGKKVAVGDLNSFGVQPNAAESTTKIGEKTEKSDHSLLSISINASFLQNPEKAFEEFSKQYPKNQIIHENKAILKQKYSLAKERASEVNRARKAIDEQKRTIQKIRQEQALASISSMDDTEVEIPAEIEAKQVIDDEKRAYKTAYQQLRELKGEIEQIQKIMERLRKKLQQDFDTWYQAQSHTAKNSDASISFLLDRSKNASSLASPEVSGEKSSIPKQAWGATNNDEARPNEVQSMQRKSSITGYEDSDADIEAFYKANELLKLRKTRRKQI